MGYFQSPITVKRNITMTRNIPTVVNDYIELGSGDLGNLGDTIRLNVKANSTNVCIGKNYVFSVSYNATSGNWNKLVPITNSIWSDDFNLEIRVSNNTYYLRIIRTVATNAAVILIDMELRGVDFSRRSNWVETSGTGSATPSVTNYAGSVVP